MNARTTSFIPSNFAICAFLVLITWLVFGRTVAHDFVNYDDRTYVYGNAMISNGITLSGLARVFTTPHAGNWHPLTTISHMIDCQIFGLRPGWHHAINVLLHTASVVLLFLLLEQMTGRIWTSTFVAALFAIHPLRVESVAWIAERKDVLSALFFILTLGAYHRFVQGHTTRRYLLVILFFVCGLMSKPMLVTLPLVLLLLDYWPFQRIVDLRSLGKMVIEKVPLFGLSIASAGATILAANQTFHEMEPVSFMQRLDNAIVSCVTYIWQMVLPIHLTVFYPFQNPPLWQVGIALVLLIAITAFAFLLRNQYPYFITGWLWYLVMLVPVIGVYQIGLHGHADRYTYLPQLGLYIAFVWWLSDMSILRGRWSILNATAGAILLIFGAIAFHQVSYWKDSRTLWTRALDVTSNNDVAFNNLGLYLQEQGDLDGALSQFREALKIESARTEKRYNLGTALTETNIGNLLSAQGRLSEGVLYYQEAISLRPEYGNAHYNLGRVYSAQGRIDNAIDEWQTTLSLQPGDGDAHGSLAGAYLKKGMMLEAIYHYERAIAAPAPSIYALNNLAWILSVSPDASLRKGDKAIALARAAVAISRGESPVFLRTLGAAYAETGNFEDAIKVSERALDLARNRQDVDLANDIEDDLAKYRIRAPVRDPSLTNAGPKT